MRILDRYILRTIIFIFLGTLVVFGLLFVLIDSASNLNDYLTRAVPLAILVQYYLAYLPYVIVQTASIACLIAVLLTFTNLNTHNEVIVLRASGMNFWQIAKPALFFALLVSVLIFWTSEMYLPQAEATRSRLITNHINVNASQQHKRRHKRPIIHNLSFYGLQNRLYFVNEFDPNTDEMSGLTIIAYDNHQNLSEKIIGLSAKWTGIAWKCYQCQVTEYGNSITNPRNVRVYPEKLLDIRETPKDFFKQRLTIELMNAKQLYAYIQRFSNSGARRALNNLRVDLNEKIAFPFGTLVIVLVGLPLALLTGRRKAQTFLSLGLAIAIGFFYYVCNAVGLALGKGGVFPPVLSAWLAPAVFTVIGVYLIKKYY